MISIEIGTSSIFWFLLLAVTTTSLISCTCVFKLIVKSVSFDSLIVSEIKPIIETTSEFGYLTLLSINSPVLLVIDFCPDDKTIRAPIIGSPFEASKTMPFVCEKKTVEFNKIKINKIKYFGIF